MIDRDKTIKDFEKVDWDKERKADKIRGEKELTRFCGIELKVFSKKLGHYIIPWCGPAYDDIDVIYADGRWYIHGGEWLDPKKYILEIIIK